MLSSATYREKVGKLLLGKRVLQKLAFTKSFSLYVIASRLRVGMQKTDLAILLFLFTIPIICVIIFLQPSSFQEALTAKMNDPNPLTFFTSIFVHGNLDHLFGKLLIFLFFGSTLYYITRIAKKEKAYLFLLILLFTLLPILFNAIFLIVLGSLYQSNISSFGLSLVGAALIGLVIPSLAAYLKSELENAGSRSFFTFGLFLLTCSAIVFSYLSSFSIIISFVGLLVSGCLISFYSFFKVLHVIPNETKTKELKKITLTVIILFSYFVLLGSLFPSNLVISEGNVVNIIAHYVGLIFGLTFGLLFFQHKKLLSTKIALKG